jgi:hypothetical protein
VRWLDEIDSKIIELLKSLEGVKQAGRVSDEMRSKLVEHEERYSSLGPIGVDNIGVRSAAERERLYFIIKDKRFRPPPTPTVQLLAEDGTVLGEEIIAGAKRAAGKEEKTVNLGKDLIIYYSRAKEKGRNSRFVLPPVPFPEIEALGFARNVVSSSPSTLGDAELKCSIGIEDDPRLASILVGFDVSR